MSPQAVFKALSDPTRREILRMLRVRPMAAGELSDAFPMTKGSLSHHYNILKAADLIRCERRGQFLVYSLNTSVLEEVMVSLVELLHPDVTVPEREETAPRAEEKKKRRKS